MLGFVFFYVIASNPPGGVLPYSSMILTTHGIVGAAIATAVVSAHPSPEMVALGTVLAFGSHFALDALPHWDYPLGSESLDSTNPRAIRFDAQFVRDMTKVALDGALGLFLGVAIALAAPSLSLISHYWGMIIWAAVLGAGGGMLPDFMQFLYMRRPHWGWLAALQRFHTWIHTPMRLRGHLAPRGIIAQALMVVVIVFIFISTM